jgi:hypothetical protein
MFHSCTLALVLPLRACVGRLCRHNCALRARRALCTCRLTQLVPIAPMSVYTNLGLDQYSRLGANAGYVVLRGHECALVLANEHKYSRVSYVPCPLFLES